MNISFTSPVQSLPQVVDDHYRNFQFRAGLHFLIPEVHHLSHGRRGIAHVFLETWFEFQIVDVHKVVARGRSPSEVVARIVHAGHQPRQRHSSVSVARWRATKFPRLLDGLRRPQFPLQGLDGPRALPRPA